MKLNCFPFDIPYSTPEHLFITTQALYELQQNSDKLKASLKELKINNVHVRTATLLSGVMAACSLVLHCAGGDCW